MHLILRVAVKIFTSSFYIEEAISVGGMGQVRSSLVERKLLVLKVLKGAFNLKTKYEYIYWELQCSKRDVTGLIQNRLGAVERNILALIILKRCI